MLASLAWPAWVRQPRQAWLEDKVLVVLDAKKERAVALAGLLELIGDVLAADGDVVENPPERQVSSDAGGAGRLEQPRRQEAAALCHHSVVEFVFDALLQRR